MRNFNVSVSTLPLIVHYFSLSPTISPIGFHNLDPLYQSLKATADARKCVQYISDHYRTVAGSSTSIGRAIEEDEEDEHTSGSNSGSGIIYTARSNGIQKRAQNSSHYGANLTGSCSSYNPSFEGSLGNIATAGNFDSYPGSGHGSAHDLSRGGNQGPGPGSARGSHRNSEELTYGYPPRPVPVAIVQPPPEVSLPPQQPQLPPPQVIQPQAQVQQQVPPLQPVPTIQEQPPQSGGLARDLSAGSSSGSLTGSGNVNAHHIRYNQNHHHPQYGAAGAALAAQQGHQGFDSGRQDFGPGPGLRSALKGGNGNGHLLTICNDVPQPFSAPHSPQKKKLTLRMKSLSLDSPESVETLQHHHQKDKRAATAAGGLPVYYPSQQGGSGSIGNSSNGLHTPPNYMCDPLMEMPTLGYKYKGKCSLNGSPAHLIVHSVSPSWAATRDTNHSTAATSALSTSSIGWGRTGSTSGRCLSSCSSAFSD